MVDLVKIRKKAKKTADGEKNSELGAQSSAGEQHVDPTPVEAEPSPEPQPAASELRAPSSKLDKFKEQAGKLREEADEQTEEAQAAAGANLELLTFVIANENYAVDIERIVEIVRPRPITRVPNAEASILGIASLRGTIVTLVDVRSRLRHPRAEETPDTRVIVVDHDSETIGFEVDRVLRVVKVAPTDVEPHPVVHSSEADESIRGVFRHAGALTILLDFDKLLGPGH